MGINQGLVVSVLVGNRGVKPVGSVFIVGSLMQEGGHNLISLHLDFCIAPHTKTTAPAQVVIKIPKSDIS